MWQWQEQRKNSFWRECAKMHGQSWKYFPQGKKQHFFHMKFFLRIRIWTGCFLRHPRQKVRSELPLLTVWARLRWREPGKRRMNWLEMYWKTGIQIRFMMPDTGKSWKDSWTLHIRLRKNSVFRWNLQFQNLKNGPTWKRRQERYYIRNRKQCLLFRDF